MPHFKNYTHDSSWQQDPKQIYSAGSLSSLCCSAAVDSESALRFSSLIHVEESQMDKEQSVNPGLVMCPPPIPVDDCMRHLGVDFTCMAFISAHIYLSSEWKRS